MDAQFQQRSEEVGAMVVNGIHEALSRVQEEIRRKGVDPQAHATGVMDGMAHMLATCAVWMINSRRGRSLELGPDEANEIHDRCKSSLLDASLRFMEAELKRLRQAGDSPGTEERTGPG
jgi:hypothetical protein